MFFVFEGVDGAGKSTQAKLFAESLRKAGHDVLFVREPGGTQLGESLRDLILSPESGDLSAIVETFLFLAARAHLCDRELRPALAAGKVIVSDRFSWSTLVYQGVVGGVSLERLEELCSSATLGVAPTASFLIDLPLAEAAQRIEGGDRMEARGLEYLEKIRQGFLELSERFPQLQRVDGSGSPEEVQARVREALAPEVAAQLQLPSKPA